jgi:hypothetical protein
VVGDALGEHPAAALEAITHQRDATRFEMFDDHEEHATKSIPPWARMKTRTRSASGSIRCGSGESQIENRNSKIENREGITNYKSTIANHKSQKRESKMENRPNRQSKIDNSLTLAGGAN